jgi:cyclase
MLQTRVIPCLQLVNDSLVKTVKFDNYGYIGDPVNTVRIFNELEVDELCFLDIRASVQNREPNFELLKQIADECFMPLSYGGGIRTFETAQKILSIGFEKVILNTQAYRQPELIKKLSEYFGAQAIIASVDVKKNLLGKYQVYINDGTEKIPVNAIEWAQKLVSLGCGELLVTSIDKDGSWSGYDIEVLKKISNAVTVPVIANGGAGDVLHIKEVLSKANVSAVALGSMVVYQKKGMGVLVNFPDKEQLDLALLR